MRMKDQWTQVDIDQWPTHIMFPSQLFPVFPTSIGSAYYVIERWVNRGGEGASITRNPRNSTKSETGSKDSDLSDEISPGNR